MKQWIKGIITLQIMLWGVWSVQAERFCSGVIDSVGIGIYESSVYLYSASLFGSEAGRKLCSLEPSDPSGKYREISAKTCEAWLNTLERAMNKQQTVIFDYEDWNSTALCHDRQTWGGYVPPVQIRVKPAEESEEEAPSEMDDGTEPEETTGAEEDVEDSQAQTGGSAWGRFFGSIGIRFGR